MPVPPPLAAPEASSLESFLRLARNVDPGSNAGLPGLSLPAGLSDDGLPIGLEVDGLPGEDRKILAVGVALEPLLGRLAPPPDQQHGQQSQKQARPQQIHQPVLKALGL